MYKKSMAWMIIIAMTLSLFMVNPIKAQADTVTKNICDADVLPNGDVAVLYISEGKVYYGTFDPDTNNWTKQEIASGKDAALAIDSSGKPHIAYIKTDDDLAYTYFNGTAWSSPKTIDSLNYGGVLGVLSKPDIALDSSGYAHITYIDSKAGYTGGNDYTPYEQGDLMYATNAGGSGQFATQVRSYSHGWFYSPDGWRNLVIAPPKITYVGGNYYIGVNQYNYDKSMVTQYHTYTYSLLLPVANEPNSLNYTINSSTYNNSRGFQLYSLDTNGTYAYSLYKMDGNLYFVRETTQMTEATKAFSGTSADLFITSSGGYYAAINSSTLLLYQYGSFKENIALSSAISSTNTSMATVVSGSKQYALYTDINGDLWICGVSTATGDTSLSTFKIPDKAPVTITGVSVAGKTYDGNAIAYTGTPSATVTATGDPASIPTYEYTWYDVTNSQTLSEAPKAVGSYKLIVSVPQSSETYYGTLEIPFSISKKTITISGVVATDRSYNGTNEVVISGGTLTGVEGTDIVSANVPSNGTAADANAGSDKAVSIADITLTGADAQNYTLNQPTGIKVDITRAALTLNAVTLDPKTYNGLTNGNVANVTFSGLQNSETLAINTDFSATCEFDNANAGTGRTTTGTVSLLSTTKANNYSLANGAYTKSGDILKASGLNALDLADIKIYKNMSYEYSFVLSSIGLNKTDTGTVTYGLGTLTGGEIFSMNPTISADGTKLNYTSASVSTGSATQVITISTQNYQDATATLTFVLVDKEPVTITGISLASKIYDGSQIAYTGEPSATITSTGTPVAVSAYSHTWYDVTNSNILLSAPKDVGSYKLIVFVADSNLTYTGILEIPFSILKKDMTIKPANKTIYKNGTLPSLEIEYVGLATGDIGSNAVTLSEDLIMEIQDMAGHQLLDSSTKGNYPIVFKNSPTITSANYNVTTEQGVLKIEKLPVTMNYNQTDTSSGIKALGLEGNINIPEKNQEDVEEVTLSVNAMNAYGNQSYDDIFKASEKTLKEKGYILLNAFDLKIVKKIKNADGTITEIKVPNEDITGPITVYLPFPENLEWKGDIGIAFIDEQGNVQIISSKRVCIDGKYYLEFKTDHFSIYGMIKVEETIIPVTGENSLRYYLIGLLIMTAGALILTRRKISNIQK